MAYMYVSSYKVSDSAVLLRCKMPWKLENKYYPWKFFFHLRIYFTNYHATSRYFLYRSGKQSARKCDATVDWNSTVWKAKSLLSPFPASFSSEPWVTNISMTLSSFFFLPVLSPSLSFFLSKDKALLFAFILSFYLFPISLLSPSRLFPHLQSSQLRTTHNPDFIHSSSVLYKLNFFFLKVFFLNKD